MSLPHTQRGLVCKPLVAKLVFSRDETSYSSKSMNHGPDLKTPSITNPFGSLSLPEVGARWALPSDHLPVGARIGEITIGSWNVLNTAYLHHIRDNSQGLAHSVIIHEHRRLFPPDPLTAREAKALAIIEEIFKKVDLLLLQESSPHFVDELIQRRPHGWIVVTGSSASSTNDICALFNSSRMSLDKHLSEIVELGFARCRSLTPGLQRPIMNLLFVTQSGERLRVIHTHAPGNPAHPAIEDLADYVEPFVTNPDDRTVLVGDLNFTEEFIRDVFGKRGLPPCTNVVHMNSHIGTEGLPKQIDHILYFGPAILAQALPPEAFGIENATTAKLLNP